MTLDIVGLQNVVYGPVKSRRLGYSLGVNLMGNSSKICSMNCIYCHCGWTQKHVNLKSINNSFNELSDTDIVLNTLDLRLKELKESDQELDYITFSGSGEASMHPDFDKIIDKTKILRDKYYKKAKVCILSNSTSVTDESIRKSLLKLDARFMKLDAGSFTKCQEINKLADGINYDDIIEGLTKLCSEPETYIQTNFFTGKNTNSDEKSLADWIEKIQQIKPSEILIYSVCRFTPDAEVIGIADEKLRQIAIDLNEKLPEIKIQPYFSGNLREENKPIEK